MRAENMSAIKRLEDLNFVRLEQALLCANCELIVNEMLNGKCPVCHSGALLSVGRLLGGPLQDPCPKPISVEQLPLEQRRKAQVFEMPM
jgi:hypothetical protein